MSDRYSILGIARTGIATANALVSRGFDVLLSDNRPAEALTSELAEIREGVLVVTGGNEVRQGDRVVISPGIGPGSPAFSLAHQRGCEVISDVELFYRMSPAPMICVTGTDGKSTTTALLGRILRDAGFHTFVGGNIGIGLMSGLDGLTEESVVVAEVSCFQLLHCPTLAPQVAVYTNIAEDHIDYHGSYQAYQAAKYTMLRNLGPFKTVVRNARDPILTSWTAPAEVTSLWFDRSCPVSKGTFSDGELIFWLDPSGVSVPIARVSELRIPGPHNLENALAATAAAISFGVAPHSIGLTLAQFEGLEHRMEYAGEVGGVLFYNDSKATNPHAAVPGVEAFGGRPLVVIAGGSEKGSDFTDYGRALSERARVVVVLGESAPRIEAAVGRSATRVLRVDSLESAVKMAYQLSQPGYVVTLCPACASFDMFRDYEQRGRVFKQAVESLKNEH